VEPKTDEDGGSRGEASASEQDCAFCRIIRGELPATAILATDRLLAFLDHRPLFRGHTLLVPRQHIRLLSDLPAEMAAEFLTTAQRLERAIEDGLGVSGTMILVNNIVSQSVPHLHLHVIPREFKDGLRFWLGPRHPYTDEHPAEAYAEKIRAALGTQVSDRLQLGRIFRHEASRLALESLIKRSVCCQNGTNRKNRISYLNGQRLAHN
jgi:histidine triad (HIT) family protein